MALIVCGRFGANATEYVPLSGLADNEGSPVPVGSSGPIFHCGIQCCQNKCNGTTYCNSFSHFRDAKICYLKDRCFEGIGSGTVPAVHPSSYTTWYAKVCNKSHVDAKKTNTRQLEVEVEAKGGVNQEKTAARKEASSSTPRAAISGSVKSGIAKFMQLGSLAADEGGTVDGPILNCGAECCQQRCREHAQCNSFSLHESAKLCYLKDRCISTMNLKGGRSEYKTWKADVCNVTPSTTPSVTQGKPAAQVSAVKATLTKDNSKPLSSKPTQSGESLNYILTQIHAHSVAEMYTDKWEGKAGSNLGSPFVKKMLEDKTKTFCTNADWRASTVRLGYTKANTARYRALFPSKGADPCSADQLYHYVGSGIGSWVSNIANVMHTNDIAQKTISFRDQRANPDGTTNKNPRYNSLFGHEFPECVAAGAKKTRVMVLPNDAGRLKDKNVCDYAAMKHYYAYQMWETMRGGELKEDLAKQVQEQLGTMLLEAGDSDGLDGVDDTTWQSAGVPFIGLHLRHKWEFKLTPPDTEHVAAALRAVVAEVRMWMCWAHPLALFAFLLVLTAAIFVVFIAWRRT